MSKINVSREQKNDPFYRYKMSEVIIKAEGGGNGKRTVLTNICTVANELKRDVDQILTYLVTVLGCKSIVNKENYHVLYGDFTKGIIQEAIYDYISLYVLCQKCKNPETVYMIGGKNEVCMKCLACPEISILSVNKNSMKILKQIATKIIEEDKKNKNKK
jgi:translation initiation factor 2 beta subunit (eIF-2beta)/eIF-5